MEPYKRDLPEIVAEILIEQHAMREEMIGMREEMSGMRGDARESAARMENLFSVMTNAVLDAMKRQNERQNNTDERQNNTTDELADLRQRVEFLERKMGR